MTRQKSLGNKPGNSLRNKLAIVGLSGLLFTGAAVGLAGVASAQDNGSVVKHDTSTQDTEGLDEDKTSEPEHGESGYLDEFELSPEDEALFERFDQCLVDNGIDIEALEAEIDGEDLTDEQLDQHWEAIEAEAEKAFETCDPILEDLSEEFNDFDEGWDEGEWDDEDWAETDPVDDFELSEEDEAVLDRFDQCLVDNGIEEIEESADGTEELTDEQWEAIEAKVEKVFETCDPILEDLSEDAEFLFEDCPDDKDHEDYDEAEELEPAPSGANA